MQGRSWKKFCFTILIPLGCILLPIAVTVFYLLFTKLESLPGFILFPIYLSYFLLFLLPVRRIPKKYVFTKGILYFLVGLLAFFMSIIILVNAMDPNDLDLSGLAQ